MDVGSVEEERPAELAAAATFVPLSENAYPYLENAYPSSAPASNDPAFWKAALLSLSCTKHHDHAGWDTAPCEIVCRIRSHAERHHAGLDTGSGGKPSCRIIHAGWDSV